MLSLGQPSAIFDLPNLLSPSDRRVPLQGSDVKLLQVREKMAGQAERVRMRAVQRSRAACFHGTMRHT
jgi:hypothetical protein